MDKSTQEESRVVDVLPDTLVQGFCGFTDRHATGRVFFVSPFGWVAFYDEEHKKQHITYAGRFLVRDEPRPEAQRKLVPDYLRRR